ncbi:RHS repeat-associated core domain-containing protein [Pseudomonas sp. S2_H01]
MTTVFVRSVLCRYRYDALDRLAAATPLAEATVQRVYQKNRLSVEIQGALHRRVMQFDDHVLAEQRAAETVLPATDLQRSVLHSVDAQGQQGIAYSPYGHRPSGSDVFSLLGFAGERPDPMTGHYPLGKGYRAYNPVLMRFNQPDSLSPFGEGGVNAYAYCQGDPVNWSDPTGHIRFRMLVPETRNQIMNPTSAPPRPLSRGDRPVNLSSQRTTTKRLISSSSRSQVQFQEQRKETTGKSPTERSQTTPEAAVGDKYVGFDMRSNIAEYNIVQIKLTKLMPKGVQRKQVNRIESWKAGDTRPDPLVRRMHEADKLALRLYELRHEAETSLLGAPSTLTTESLQHMRLTIESHGQMFEG